MSKDSKFKIIKYYMNKCGFNKNCMYKISVIIPVYNNGNHLKNKCIESLTKSSMFNNMELIIVDDGSNEETLKIVQNLKETYSNIKVYFFEDGGSGSASRPRNFGIRQATSEYITFLDPDNEAINDGYAKLYKCLEEDNYDLVLGNMERIMDENKKIHFPFYKRFTDCHNGEEKSNNGISSIKKLKFMVDSIQALIVKKSIVIQNNLLMENGAIGQDTVFFLELMMCSDKIKVINEDIHIYNSYIKSSVTNKINKNYFVGHYINEIKKMKVLKQYGVLDEYFNDRQERYFKPYIFDKFINLDNDSKKEIYPIMKNIYDIYEGKWNIKSKIMKEFFEKLKFSIIIPVYNNGEYLRDVCFNSLKKSSLFRDMELIIVDDGSTDNKTINIINDLAKKYKNIKTYFFNDGGSGSPSRPRNIGIKLSTTDYITYLDPDNEAYDDGYAKLYNEIITENCDLVIGNIILKNNATAVYSSYSKKFLKCNKKSKITMDGKSILVKTDFNSQSIQACIIKKSLLINNKLEMVFGGIGEDTLFFYQLLINSKKTKVIEDIIHIYHMSREDSITNSINSKYFEKHLLVEIYKRSFLQQNDILTSYLKNKQDFYFRNFIFRQIYNVKDETEKEVCFNYIDRMYKVFYDIWQVKDVILINYFKNRGVYREKPFEKTIIVYLSDDDVVNKLKKLDKENESDNIEIILVEYYLKDKDNVDKVRNFELNNKNVKLYYQNEKEKIDKVELEKRVLYLSTTEKITIENK